MQTIPAREVRTEIEVLKSRFIASLAPAFSVDEARAFISRIKDEFGDATHNVPLFVVGHGASVTAHSSDDGEPSGTAGRPALAVLQGSGLGDTAVVITRYYGGTKLGTGGLVRAYGDAVRAVLEVTPRAAKVATYTVLTAVPYNFLDRVRLLVPDYDGLILDEEFAADITLTLRFRTAKFPLFQEALTELSYGQIDVEIIETNEATIMPIDN